VWQFCSCHHPAIATSHPFLLTQVEEMAQQTEICMARAIRVLSKCYSAPIGSINPSVGLLHLLSEFIAQLDDGFARPLIIKYSHLADVPLQTLKDRFNNKKRTEQSLSLAQNGW